MPEEQWYIIRFRDIFKHQNSTTMDDYEAGTCIFLTRSSILQPISEWLLFILHVGYIQFVIIVSKYFNILKYDWTS